MMLLLAAMAIVACSKDDDTPAAPVDPGTEDVNPTNPEEEKEQPASQPVYNHWSLEVSPYAFPNHSDAMIYVKKGDETVDLSGYEIAVFNSKGQCAGIAMGNKGTSTLISVYGEEDDTYTFHLWDCIYAKERPVTETFHYTTSETIPDIYLKI